MQTNGNVLFLLVAVGCAGDLTGEEEARLRAMEMRAELLPASPTNAYADDAKAVELGRRLFFDRGMSADGSIACASCHDPLEGFSDPRAVSLGVADREGERHSMPITAVAMQRWFLWDGRADSLWSQPLKAIEAEREMDFTRVEVAHFIARQYAPAYEAIFGPLPVLDGLPARARPGMGEWDAMTQADRDATERLFANVGKALEAYQRRLLCSDTRFDRWARGELELDADERAGAAEFVRNDCIDCHSGPAFSDGAFHNVGLGSAREQPDVGRAAAREILLADPFNGAGAHSDDPITGAARLEALAGEEATLGAFRTPSLRGVGQRRFFGHRGHREAVADFIEAVYDDVELEHSAVGELDPKVRDVEFEADDEFIAFLRTLDCGPVPAELLDPHAR